MTKKKKTFRKFINEQVLGVKQKEKQFDKFEDFVKDVKGIKPPENKAASFQEFINEARGYEFDNDSVDKFDKMVIESKIEREQQKLEERKTRIDPNPIVLTNEQIEEMNRRRIIEEINEVLKHRDPVLVKMSFQQWLNIPHNKFVFELDEYQAKRLYEQDMSRVEKYEELKKKSGKGRNRVAQATSEETAPLSDPIIPAIWGKPATAHPYDDEFESNTLDAAWAAPYGPSSTLATTDPIDPYDSGWSPANEGRYNVNTTHRPSFLMLQGNETWVQTNKPITLATNMFCYVRFSFHSRTAPSNNQVLGELRLGQDGYNNAARLTFANTDNNVLNVDYHVHVSGSENDVGTTTDVDSKGQAIEYAAIHKVGTTYHGWAGTESNWIYLGSHTANYNSSGQVSLINVSAESEKIVGFDFVRFIETDKFPF